MTHPAIRNGQFKSTVLRSFNLLCMFTSREVELSLGQFADRFWNPKISTHRLVPIWFSGELERIENG
jgi:hypothetical protein